MTSLESLLQFCDFLQNRVHTSSLSLFRRMLHDFYCGNERTLLEFTRLGANIVTIFPMELKSQRRLHEAEHLLAQQQQMDCGQQRQLCVFQYLLTRVATKNILCLRDIFQQFCQGDDSLLQEFIRQGNEVISVIPIDIQTFRQTSTVPTPAVMATKSISDVLALAWTSTTPATTPPSTSALGVRPRHEQQFLQIEEDAGPVYKRVRTAMEASLSFNTVPRQLMSSSQDEISARITDTLERIEKQEPWKTVFNTDEMIFPFHRAKYPKLGKALQTFWTKHSRAVWERQFWAPLVRTRAPYKPYERKTRQTRARKAFEDVMRLIYNTMGAVFFVQLDQRPRPHKSWWYKTPVLNLMSVAQSTDLTTCLRYIESQALTRFPVAPGMNRRNVTSNISNSRSMWSTTNQMKPILSEICAHKAANSLLKSKN